VETGYCEHFRDDFGYARSVCCRCHTGCRRVVATGLPLLCEDVVHGGSTASYSAVQVNATLPYSLIDVFVHRGRCAG
jgi:hypothetical protein